MRWQKDERYKREEQGHKPSREKETQRNREKTVFKGEKNAQSCMRVAPVPMLETERQREQETRRARDKAGKHREIERDK